MEKINFPDILYESYLKEISGIKFTRRETEIIAFILSGRSRKKIASILSISPKTVENHKRNIMEKLGCNTQEHIIDFIEKSGKLLLLKQYYLNWIIHTEFEEILKDLALLKEKLACSIVCWSLEKDEYFLLPHLKAHLKLAGVKVTNDIHQKQQPLSTLLTESTKSMYKLYLLPKHILYDTLYHRTDNPTAHSKLFILPELVDSDKFLEKLMGYNCIDLTQIKNYYFLLFEILKRLFVNQPIEKLFINFQGKMVITQPRLRQYESLPLR
jgi:DNA-binding CsgD family transcriptional regulator